MNAYLLLALCVASAVAVPNGYYSAPAPAVRAEAYYSAPASSLKAAHIPIVKQVLRNDNSGNYNLEVETGDGTKTSESGSLKNLGHPEGPSSIKEGSYSWTAPDGQVFTVTYTADENGFVARGAHLPTPPPIPEEIQKSLALPRNPEYYSAPALKADSGYYSAPALKADSGYYSAPAPAPALKVASSSYYSAPAPSAAPSIRFDFAPVKAASGYKY